MLFSTNWCEHQWVRNTCKILDSMPLFRSHKSNQIRLAHAHIFYRLKCNISRFYCSQTHTFTHRQNIFRSTEMLDAFQLHRTIQVLLHIFHIQKFNLHIYFKAISSDKLIYWQLLFCICCYVPKFTINYPWHRQFVSLRCQNTICYSPKKKIRYNGHLTECKWKPITFFNTNGIFA